MFNSFLRFGGIQTRHPWLFEIVRSVPYRLSVIYNICAIEYPNKTTEHIFNVNTNKRYMQRNMLSVCSKNWGFKLLIDMFPQVGFGNRKRYVTETLVVSLVNTRIQTLVVCFQRIPNTWTPDFSFIPDTTR